MKPSAYINQNESTHKKKLNFKQKTTSYGSTVPVGHDAATKRDIELM